MRTEDLQAHVDAFESYVEYYEEMLMLPNGEDSYAIHRQELARGERLVKHYKGLLARHQESRRA